MINNFGNYSFECLRKVNNYVIITFATHMSFKKVKYFIKTVCETRCVILPSLRCEQVRLFREEKQDFPGWWLILTRCDFAFLFAVTQRAIAAESDSKDGVKQFYLFPTALLTKRWTSVRNHLDAASENFVPLLLITGGVLYSPVF